MTAVAAPIDRTPVPPGPVRWTKAQYHQMREMGWFFEKHVEPIAGEIIEERRMTPQHWVAVNLTGNLMPKLFHDDHSVCVRGEIDMGDDSEPRPDLAITFGRPFESLEAMPTTAVLIIEVADFTITEDRYRKGSLYARAAVLDNWIVNLRKCCVAVYREPVPMSHKPFGFGYEKMQAFFWDETVSPLVKPEVLISVADLLPKPITTPT